MSPHDNDLAWAYWLDVHADSLAKEGELLFAGATRTAADRIRTLTADNERLREALKRAKQQMLACADNVEHNKVCFDGDEWHMTMNDINAALNPSCEHTPTQGSGATFYCMKCGENFLINWAEVRDE